MDSPLLQTRKPFLTIRPSAGWQAIDLREIWRFRDLLYTLAGRDIKLRYRQTALGAAWVVLQPLMAAGIFSFVFGRVAKLPSEGVPYFIFSYAGLLGWNAFSTTLTKTSGCLVGNSHLVSKVYFPRLVLPLSTICSTLIDFGVALAMMAVLLIVNRIVPGPGILLLPIWLLLLMMLSLGIGLFAAALMVSYRDVGHIMPVVNQFLLYASPVAYSIAAVSKAVPEKFVHIYMLNPLSGLLEGFRWSLLGVGELHAWALVYSSLLAVSVFLLGAFSFKKMERKFADVI